MALHFKRLRNKKQNSFPPSNSSEKPDRSSSRRNSEKPMSSSISRSSEKSSKSPSSSSSEKSDRSSEHISHQSNYGYIPKPRRGGLVPAPTVVVGKPSLDVIATRKVIYHKHSDLSSSTYDEGSPINLNKAEHVYSAWDECVQPLQQSNIATGLAGAISLVARLASKGTEGLTHYDCWETVRFLRSILDDSGELPPNILGLLEYIDYQTKDDATSLPDQKSILF